MVFASKGCKCKHKQISYFTHEHYVEVFLPHCVLILQSDKGKQWYMSLKP